MDSPCTLVCSIHAKTGFCLGCGRTIEEIGAWTTLSDTERRALMDRLPARLGTAALMSARMPGLAPEPAE